MGLKRESQIQCSTPIQEDLRLSASPGRPGKEPAPAPPDESANDNEQTGAVRKEDPLPRDTVRPWFSSQETLQSVSVIGLFVIGVLYSVYFARNFILPVTAAAFLKLVLSPAVRRFKKWGIPEGIGAGGVVLLTLICGFGLVYQLSGPARQWVERAPRVLDEAERKLAGVKESIANISRAAEQVEKIADVDGEPDPPPVALRGDNLTSLVFESTQSFIAMAVATVVLLYLLLASGDHFVRKAITVFRRRQDKVRAFHLSRQLEQTLSRYFLTVSAINLGLGSVVALAMYLLEMPNPLLWGAMVAVFNFVPYLGAFASLTILTLAAIVTFDDLGRALVVGLVFFSLNLLEAYVVTPTLLGYRMRMSPVAIFISIMFFGWAWGVYGILFAVPILVTFKLFCEHVEPLTPVAQFLDGDNGVFR